jgi:hypothetical protein
MAAKDGDVRQVVAVRLAGWELFALDQMADLMDEHRSDMVRRSIAEFMRRAMREHPVWPLHPAWADAGDERWVMTNFQHWAYAVADVDPGKYLEKVKLDGVTAYRWREGRPTPKLTEWKEHVARYHARKAKEAR